MAARNKRQTGVAKGSTRTRGDTYVLRLFVAGTTPRSMRAILDARAFCESHLANRYELEVIDIYQQPGMARDEQIIAVPTLVRSLPPPLRRLVGDLSNVQRVLAGLELINR
jgi:circadian clock protein KaiB